ncbi:hypothetical protein HBZC1_00640 [Helicobacter bizzozeronii CIII-1]|uniref:Coiled-coil domain-containing protein n=2 Tax=Helicobacter bizzozeronii TaxID=56877 RepID=F8KQP6_HELBC|nr:hypothetical protein HBZC1_00640 [Helicobacter bizzozeronii CIII-1]
MPIKRSTTLGGAFALYIIKPPAFRSAPLNAPLERLTLVSSPHFCFNSTKNKGKVMAEPTLQDQEVELETLKREIKQAEDSLESDFAKYAAEHIDADLEALFFDDKPGFIKKLLEMQNQFLQEQLGSKVERAKQLQGEITQKKGLEQLEQDKAQFLQEHPDANMDELINFYNEELPPKYQKQLESLQGVEFFNALYELFKAYKGAPEPQEQQKEELPQRLEGNTPESPSPSNAELVMNRF